MLGVVKTFYGSYRMVIIAVAITAALGAASTGIAGMVYYSKGKSAGDLSCEKDKKTASIDGIKNREKVNKKVLKLDDLDLDARLTAEWLR